jgi:hypothetical protein
MALVLASCTSDSSDGITTPANSGFAGTYQGAIRAVSVLDGTPTPGAFLLTVATDGTLKFTVYDINSAGTFTLTGRVTDAGSITAQGSDGAATMTGQMQSSAVQKGLWSNGSSHTSGIWYAETTTITTHSLFTTNVDPSVRITNTSVLNQIGIPSFSNVPDFMSLVLPSIVANPALAMATAQPAGTQSVGKTYVHYGDGSSKSSDFIAFTMPGANGTVTWVSLRVYPPLFFVPPLLSGLGLRPDEFFTRSTPRAFSCRFLNGDPSVRTLILSVATKMTPGGCN